MPDCNRCNEQINEADVIVKGKLHSKYTLCSACGEAVEDFINNSLSS